MLETIVQRAAVTIPATPRPTRPPEVGACRLGDTWFRVRSFQTRRPGDALTDTPRTVGQVGLALGRAPLTAGPAEAAELCARLGGDAPAGAARGKVVFLGRGHETRVFQADPVTRTAAAAACGNASGAAAALLASTSQAVHLRQALVLPEGVVTMHATVHPAPGGWLVEQSWSGVCLQATEARFAARDVIVCTGTLNDYLLVPVADAAGFDAFGLDQALALWAEAGERFGFADPLRGRLAVIDAAADTPRVKFFTCGRQHPGAPLTGLAALSLAADRSARLAPLRRAGQVAHPRGSDALPQVRLTPAGTRIDLPAIHVQLHEG